MLIFPLSVWCFYLSLFFHSFVFEILFAILLNMTQHLKFIAFFSIPRNPLLSLSKPHKVTHHLLLIWVLVHHLQCISACHLMVLLSSMDHLSLHMTFHFLGAQHIITTTEAVYLQAALTDLCIFLDQRLIQVDQWWVMVIMMCAHLNSYYWVICLVV